MSRTDEELLDVLDVLYEGMLDDTAWQRALVRVADFVSGSAVILFSADPSTGEVYRSDIARLEAAVMRQYEDTWIRQDPRHLAGLTCTVGEPQVDGMLVDPRRFRRSEVFNELLGPADIPYHLATWLERRPTRGVVLSVLGSRARGTFVEGERRKMAVLVPHLRRIVAMKDRLVRARTTADNLLETMDRLPFGLLLLAADWEILEASAKAEAVLAERSAIRADGRRLAFVRKSDERAFAARVRENPVRARLDDALSVARTGALPPLSLLVLPLKPSQEEWLGRSARWLVLVFDPQSALPLPEQSLQQALGITAAEAALARRLANGLSVAQAAEELSVSINTVRAQLKSIYSKSGVHTQAQLVRRIFTSPAIVGLPTPKGRAT